MSITFQDLGLQPALVNTVTQLDYIKPTPIQEQAIPIILRGRDLMGQAQTGTGKTAAFTLPMLNKLSGENLQALVLTPTRELAGQVSEAVYRYGNQLGVRVLPIYGGQSYSRQKRRLQKGVQVVVGTPGRTLDLINQGALKLHNVHYLVLDEADEMLKMGFIDDVEAIIKACNNNDRQTVIVSATLSKDIQRLASNYMKNPETIIIEQETMTAENVSQRYYVVNHREKVAALCRLLEVEDLQNTLIFARTRAGATELAETLSARGYQAESIQGELAQAERERILGRFRHGQCNILVATDVVARGVDIPDVSHVINFDLPLRGEEYTHRIGRTGRAGRMGDAISFITPRQKKLLKDIQRYIQMDIRKAQLPSKETVFRRRSQRISGDILAQLQTEPSDNDINILDSLIGEGYTPDHIAVAAIRLLRANEAERPLEDIREDREFDNSGGNSKNSRSNKRYERNDDGTEKGMTRLKLGAGRKQKVKPGDVVRAIASQTNIPGKEIGAITILNFETFVDVPDNYAGDVLGANDITLNGNQADVSKAKAGEGGRNNNRRGGGKRRSGKRRKYDNNRVAERG